jgi:hypothetical protein
MPGPNGIMIASEDVEALNQFEQLLSAMYPADGKGGGPQMTIFYLKHAKANIVGETLDQIFGGGTLAGGGGNSGGGGGGLLGGLAGAALGGGDGGGILGSLLGLGGGDGGNIAPSGSIKITPDLRLNALIVQANEADVATIEALLKILDLDKSPEEIMIRPIAKMIALKNTQAEEVAMILKEVYQDRMVAGPNQPGRPPSPQEFMQMLGGGGRGGRRGGGNQRGGTQEEPQKMTVSIDTRTNSIVLAAPEPLFSEVQQTIEQIDAAALTKSDQTMEVLRLHRTGADTMQMALGALLGDGIQFSRPMGGRTMMRSTVNRRQMGTGMQGGYAGARQGGMNQPGMMQQGGMMQPGGMMQQGGAGMRAGGGGFQAGRTGGAGFQPGGAGFQPGGAGFQTGGAMPMMQPGMGGTGGGNFGAGGTGGGRMGGGGGGGRTGGGGGGRTGGGRGGNAGGGQF